LYAIQTQIRESPVNTSIDDKEKSVVATRRAFLQSSGLLAGEGVVSGTTLAALVSHTAKAGDGKHESKRKWFEQGRSEYGSLRPTPDQDGNMIWRCRKDLSTSPSARSATP
jgi:hypothetical protein